jgi:hypothetical protein
MDGKKLKIDPSKVEYDGHSFRLIVDENSFIKRLKEKQVEILEDLEKTEVDPEADESDYAARGDSSAHP